MGQLKTERLQIRITPDLKQLLQEQAEKENRSLSNYIEILIKNAVSGGVENEKDF